MGKVPMAKWYNQLRMQLRVAQQVSLTHTQSSLSRISLSHNLQCSCALHSKFLYTQSSHTHQVSLSFSLSHTQSSLSLSLSHSKPLSVCLPVCLSVFSLSHSRPLPLSHSPPSTPPSFSLALHSRLLSIYLSRCTTYAHLDQFTSMHTCVHLYHQYTVLNGMPLSGITKALALTCSPSIRRQLYTTVYHSAI